MGILTDSLFFTGMPWCIYLLSPCHYEEINAQRGWITDQTQLAQVLLLYSRPAWNQSLCLYPLPATLWPWCTLTSGAVVGLTELNTKCSLRCATAGPRDSHAERASGLIQVSSEMVLASRLSCAYPCVLPTMTTVSHSCWRCFLMNTYHFHHTWPFLSVGSLLSHNPRSPWDLTGLGLCTACLTPSISGVCPRR